MQDSATKRSLTLTYRGPPQNNTDLQRLLMEKQLNQERLLKELAYKDESFQLFQNDHNLKLDQYSHQINQDVLKIKRKYELEIDGLKGTIVRLQGDLRESLSRQHSLQIEVSELTSRIDDLVNQLMKAKSINTEKQQDIQKLANALKQLQVQFNINELRNQDMKQEIMVLLQVEKVQASEILSLKQNELQQGKKIEALAKALAEIESHLLIFTDKLKILQTQNSQLKYLVSKLDADVLQKQQIINKLRLQLEQSVRRQKIREDEVKRLIVQNERLYNELGSTRHRLHDLAVAYNINV